MLRIFFNILKIQCSENEDSISDSDYRLKCEDIKATEKITERLYKLNKNLKGSISENLEYLETLEELDVSNLNIARIPTDYQILFKSLKKLNISNNPNFEIYSLEKNFIKNITILIVQNCNLNFYDLDFILSIPNLTIIDLSKNKNLQLYQHQSEAWTTITDLSLNDCNLTKEDLFSLSCLSNLKHLSITNNPVANFYMFFNSHLESLNLSDCGDSDVFYYTMSVINYHSKESFANVNLCRTLKVLHLPKSALRYFEIEYLKTCHNLKSLFFKNSQEILLTDVFNIIENIEILSLENCFNSNENEIVNKFIQQTKISQFSLIIQFCKNLKTLTIKNIDLSDCKIDFETNPIKFNLKNLTISNCNLQSQHMNFINSFIFLEHLNLSENPHLFIGQPLETLSFFNFSGSLKYLNITNCGNITYVLQTAIQNCKLNVLIADNSHFSDVLFNYIMYEEYINFSLNFENVKCSLKSLSFRNCRIKNLEKLLAAISVCECLEYLDLSYNTFHKNEILFASREVFFGNYFTFSLLGINYGFDIIRKRIFYLDNLNLLFYMTRFALYNFNWTLNSFENNCVDIFKFFYIGEALFPIDYLKNTLQSFYLINVFDLHDNLKILFALNFADVVKFE